MQVELSKIDLLNLLKGTSPSYEVMGEIPEDFGHYVGGMVDDWEWVIDIYFDDDIEDYDEYSEEFIWNLYQKCK